LEREETRVRAAQSAFAAAFAGARVVDRGLQCGDGVAWTWVAELAGGRLCAVLLAAHAGRELAAVLLDGAAEFAEHEGEVRRVLGLSSTPSRGGPLVVAIYDEASRAFERRIALTDPQRIDAFALQRVNTSARSQAVLQPLRELASARKSMSRTGAGVDMYPSEFSSSSQMLTTLQHRMQRLDPAVEIERDAQASVFRIHGHELARVEPDGENLVAHFGDEPTGLTLGNAADLERFLAHVVERYLELGCWSGSEGGAAALALGEPLLSHEEMAAFRELA
jgi:hypothetical protein